MKEILSFFTGAIMGAVFAFFNLPIPAPSVFAGILGILGIFVGYKLVKGF